MSTTATEPKLEVQTFEFAKDTLVAAAPDVVWEAVLAECGPESTMPDGKPFPFKLEAWPGGRWFRDLGNNTGHLWGHVQVIKPPKIIELYGQMMMSYAATNHAQYKLESEGKGTRLKFTHQSIGLIAADHRDGLTKGFQFWLERIRDLAQDRSK